MVDVDCFKAKTTAYGHFAGDQVLRAAADALRETMRPGARGYRFGGEEFLIILPTQSLRDGCRAAERLRAAVAALALPHAASPIGVISVSAGVALWAREGMTMNAWLKQADEALYHAKSLGRNCVFPAPDNPHADCFSTTDMDAGH